MSTLKYNITFTTDNGFWGRECNVCKKYFKIDSKNIKPQLYCPYCGELQPNDKLWTKDQNQKAREIATKIGKRYLEDEMEKMFKQAFGNSKIIKYTPGTKTRVDLNVKKHLEKPVDTEIECPVCNLRFQVFGIFGYCPSCREENIKIYETNFQIILHEINNAKDKNRALRHAYNDIVSTFESYCKLVSTKFNLGTANFQNLKSSKDLFKKYSLDIFLNVTDDEKIFLKRIFEKRHAYQHAQGLITEKYIQNIPFDRHLLGQTAELSVQEITDGIDILKKVVKNITDKYSC